MTLRYQLTEEEFVRVSFWMARSKRSFKVRIALMALIYIPLLCYFGHVSFQTGAVSPVIWVIVAVVLFMIWSIFVRIPRKVRRVYAQQKSLRSEVELQLDEAGFSLVAPNGSFAQPWEDFHRWTVNREFMILYLSEEFAQIIPLRVFSSEEELKTLTGWLEAKIPRR